MVKKKESQPCWDGSEEGESFPHLVGNVFLFFYWKSTGFRGISWLCASSLNSSKWEWKHFDSPQKTQSLGQEMSFESVKPQWLAKQRLSRSHRSTTDLFWSFWAVGPLKLHLLDSRLMNHCLLSCCTIRKCMKLIMSNGKLWGLAQCWQWSCGDK